MKSLFENLKSNIKTIYQGAKLIKCYLGKGYVELKTLLNIIRSISPYFSVFMTGRIISLLAKNTDYELILKNILFAVIITLLLDILSRFINRKCLIMINSCWYKHEAMLSKKAFSLDYSKAESASISTLRAKISENARINGGGVIWLADSIGTIVAEVFSIIVGIIMVLKGFSTSVFIDLQGVLKLVSTKNTSIVFLLAIFLLSTTIVITNYKTTKLTTKVTNKRSKTIPIMDYYYGKVFNEAGFCKDIHIYNESILINNELSKNIVAPHIYSEEQIYKHQITRGFCPIVATTLIGGMVYILIGLRALVGLINVGNVVECYGATTKLISAVSLLISELGYIKNNNIFLKQELEYLNINVEKEQSGDGLERINLEEVTFEFRNVSFKYPDTEQYVIKNISFKIEAGQHIAIVGMNGSGKSTIVKLLCRLYEPTEGYITVNNIDIRKFNDKEYLKLFSVVFQDYKLLAFSVGQNLCVGDNCDEEKAWISLEQAGIKERVEHFPKKLKQPLYKLYEKDGIDISCGEEQKIAIARALYKDAPVIVLDEPTASLDPMAETEIYSKLYDVINNKTALFISHRLSSCRFCDNIIVLKDGEIVDEGTHNELIKKENSEYSILWNAQAQHYVECQN